MKENNPKKPVRIFNSECQSVFSECHKKSLTPSETRSIFLKAWNSFSKQYQSSPSRTNNNITNNCRRRIGSSCTSTSIVKTDAGYIKGSNPVKSPPPSSASHLFYILHLILNLVEFIGIILIFQFIFYTIIVLHKPTAACISRNTQDLIYPLMRNLRLAALPILRRYPSVTGLYEESCLITNPFFLNSHEYECWPCEAVRQVIDLTSFSNFSSSYYQGGIPFVVKDAFSTDDVGQIEKMYSENTEFMSSVNLESNTQSVKNWYDIFSMNKTTIFDKYDDLHIAWKINRVAETRIVRKYFIKPYFIPDKTEMSIQRFIFLDNFNAQPYFLPFTEFANVFLLQASGHRNIVLFPSLRCQTNCKTVTILLVRGDVLFYNWLYWRPKSVPADSSSLFSRDKQSIAYIGSFY